MISSTSRSRLLAGAALGFGLAVFTPTMAQAQCAPTPTVAPHVTVVCGTTTTDDSTLIAGASATSRNYQMTTAGGDATGTISAGAVINGFGLAFTNTAAGANELFVVNNGTVQVDAGNTPISGGSGALNITGIGATNIDYSGTGSIANLSLTGGRALEIDHSGTGNITASIGGNASSLNPGLYTIGVFQNGTDGNVSVTTATGTTITGPQGGIFTGVTNVASDGTVTVLNNAAIGSPTGSPNTFFDGINAFSSGTGAVSVTNNGAIGSAADRAQAFGINADINNATSAAALNVSGTGAIFSVSDGLDIDNAGTGTTTVNYTGAINTTAGDGIDVTATTGALSVTSGAITAVGGNGILTTTTTGNQTISVGGNVVSDTNGVNATSTSGTIAVTTTGGADITGGTDLTEAGIFVSSAGNRTVTIGAGSVVTGNEGIRSSGAGTTTITNAGTITGTNAAISAGALTNGAFTITNQAGGTINGRLSLTDNNDTVTNAGTLALSGAQNFNLGTDTLANQAGGTITVAAGTTFNGLETLSNAGTVTAASGLTFDAGNTALNNTGTINLTGALDLGAGTDTFANTGTGILNLTGNSSLVGIETLTQSGRINLNTFTLTGTGAFANSGTIDTSGNASLLGFTSLSNSGTLDLAAGTLTVPAVVFTNTGTILADEGATTITGQTSFANSGTIDLQDGAVGDVLTINSAFVGSGGSNLDVDFTGSASDRLVITGAASGTTTVDAAYLGGGFNLDGVLVVDTASSSANAFVLGAVTGETPLLDVSLVQAGADYFLVAAPTAAAFNPLVVPGFATDLWYQSADEVFAETVKPATTSGISFWGEGYYSRDKYGDGDDSVVVDGIEFDVDNERKTKRYGAQLGVDYGFDGARIGLTGGYAWADAEGNADADLKAKGWNIGVYGQFGGLTGFHGEFLAKHDRYDAEFDNGVFDGEEFDIRSTGVDGSLGYRFGFGGGATMDIHGGLSHVRTKVDDIGAFGFNYDIEKLTSTRGRLGARAIFGGSLSPYIDGTVYREFDGDGEVELFDGTAAYDLDTEGKGTWVRLEAGLSGNDGPGPILAAFGDFGDRKGFGVRAGWRLGGAAVAAAPPPPPPAPYVAPPAPPPPATQTCPDGSVILATDMCPPPPPPPPPPPEPERG